MTVKCVGCQAFVEGKAAMDTEGRERVRLMSGGEAGVRRKTKAGNKEPGDVLKPRAAP